MISFEIQKKISQSCESEYIILDAPVDVILSPYEVRQPDFILIHRERLDILSKRGVVGAPDLEVEILSPSKLKTYSHYGIPEYWIVNPETGI